MKNSSLGFFVALNMTSPMIIQWYHNITFLCSILIREVAQIIEDIIFVIFPLNLVLEFLLDIGINVSQVVIVVVDDVDPIF